MKTMMLTGIRSMELRKAPDPRIERETDVLLKVEAVGVCGSDVHYYLTGRIGDQVVKYPFPVGHEMAGTVMAAGSGVTRAKAGDRVAVDPAMSCGECDQCRAGRANTCRNLRFLGCPGQAEGCLSEYIVMPAESCYPLSENISMEQTVIAEPLSIGVYAVRQSIPMPGAGIGILGAGPIGLSVLLAAKADSSRRSNGQSGAKAEGAQRIFITDKIDDRLKAAEKAGADWTGNPDRDDIVSGIIGVEPRQLDAVFECCGEQEALDQAIKLLRPGGKLMIVGIPRDESILFNAHQIRRKEITICNVRRQNGCVQAALDLIESGRADVDFMLTHRFPFARTKEAFDLVADYLDGVIKAVIRL